MRNMEEFARILAEHNAKHGISIDRQIEECIDTDGSSRIVNTETQLNYCGLRQGRVPCPYIGEPQTNVFTDREFITCTYTRLGDQYGM